MNKPIWNILVDGTDTSVPWTDHPQNRRFAIYKAGTLTNPNDDLVLDKETGLVWPRNGNIFGTPKNWLDANTECRSIKFGNRIGWRLPTVEELSSLIDTRRSRPALPNGHPFVSIQVGDDTPAYWTSTNNENPSSSAWFVNLDSGAAGIALKQILGFVLPVRGGRGGINWNA